MRKGARPSDATRISPETKRVRLSLGKDPQDAAAKRLRKEAELNAVNNGIAIVAENGPRKKKMAKKRPARNTKKARPA